MFWTENEQCWVNPRQICTASMEEDGENILLTMSNGELILITRDEFEHYVLMR